MYTLYKLDSADLNESFLASLKLLFAGKVIEIAVREVEPVSAHESNNVWQAIERFRQVINPADFSEDEDLFADVRDRGAGREVVF